ncbi:MAG: hypothetical protein EA397_20420 [Deltaproteobacteria bacterium]|nr:MAG: hypothetical protein EA397_20420 [Deltaproteobacteria bacterium]
MVVGSAILISLFGSAVAAPTFEGVQPDDLRLAKKAYRAGVLCTGWEPPHHPSVKLQRRDALDGYDGRAYLDGEGIYRIEISESNPGRTLLHELAHAWASRGPATLTEGRADLLADCMATHLRRIDLFDPDPGRDLDALPDLRRWSNPRAGHTARTDDQERADAYLGASRLMRVIVTLVPLPELYPQDGLLRWRELDRLLERAGPRGAIILDMLAGGAGRQAQALTDHDRDAQPWLAEILSGTDPNRWDSSGDGWWDGSPPAPPGAVPLPPDGSAVCSGMSASPRGARVEVRVRATRASAPPKVRVIAGDTWLIDDPTQGVSIEPNQPILLALDGGLRGATGGAWAMVGGQDLYTSWNCKSEPHYTTWIADPTFAPHLETFQKELREIIARADSLIGPSTRRLVVAIGADSTHVDADGVRLSTGFLAWALERGRIDAIAGLAVALQRAWLAPPDERRWDTAEALLHALLDDPPKELLISADPDQRDARTAEASRCGWHGTIVGPCPKAVRPAPPERPTRR